MYLFQTAEEPPCWMRPKAPLVLLPASRTGPPDAFGAVPASCCPPHTCLWLRSGGCTDPSFPPIPFQGIKAISQHQIWWQGVPQISCMLGFKNVFFSLFSPGLVLCEGGGKEHPSAFCRLHHIALLQHVLLGCPFSPLKRPNSPAFPDKRLSAQPSTCGHTLRHSGASQAAVLCTLVAAVSSEATALPAQPGQDKGPASHSRAGVRQL